MWRLRRESPVAFRSRHAHRHTGTRIGIDEEYAGDVTLRAAVTAP
jgi:hypothetical protein